jgi:esterase/lipase
MAKVVYIIPGYQHTTSLKSYREVARYFKSRNYQVELVKINWARRVMSDYVAEAKGQVVRHKKGDAVCLFGFSFGAFIALNLAEQIIPKYLILGSLSPYFKEDLPYVKKTWKEFWGKRRIKDFSNFYFNKLVKKVKCSKIYLLGGGDEVPELKRRLKEAVKKIRNSELYYAEQVGHDLGHKNYLKLVKEIVSNI